MPEKETIFGTVNLDARYTESTKKRWLSFYLRVVDPMKPRRENGEYQTIIYQLDSRRTPKSIPAYVKSGDEIVIRAHCDPWGNGLGYTISNVDFIDFIPAPGRPNPFRAQKYPEEH